jgi:hypothetical protein
MNQLAPTRVIELAPGQWVVQFEGGLDGWTTFSDVFATQSQAQAFQQEQIDLADTGR